MGEEWKREMKVMAICDGSQQRCHGDHEDDGRDGISLHVRPSVPANNDNKVREGLLEPAVRLNPGQRP